MAQPRHKDAGAKRKSAHHAALSLVEGPTLPGHVVLLNPASYTIIIDKTLLYCSYIEYKLFLTLMKDIGECVPFEELFNASTFDHQRDSAALQKRIARLRQKLPQFLHIACLLNEGYSLKLQVQNDEHASLPSKRNFLIDKKVG